MRKCAARWAGAPFGRTRSCLLKNEPTGVVALYAGVVWKWGCDSVSLSIPVPVALESGVVCKAQTPANLRERVGAVADRMDGRDLEVQSLSIWA